MSKSNDTRKTVIEVLGLFIGIISCCATVTQTVPVVKEWIFGERNFESIPTPTEVIITNGNTEIAEPSPTSSLSSTPFLTLGYATISNELVSVKLRLTPGYSNKNDTIDVIAEIPQGAVVQIIEGPENVDNLSYWKVSWNGLQGWIAEKTASGKVIMLFE